MATLSLAIPRFAPNPYIQSVLASVLRTVARTSAPTALFLGFVALTLSLILFVLGVPAIRDLVR